MTTLAQLSTGATQKETTVNENFKSVSPMAIFSERPSAHSGLTFGYYGGMMLVDGVVTSVSNGTVALSNGTNYMEVSRSGVISLGSGAFSPDKFPLYEIVASGGVVTSVTDRRTKIPEFLGKAANISVTTADVTPTVAQGIRSDMMTFSGALTASRNVIFPTRVGRWFVQNNCTGGTAPGLYTLTAKTSAGTGVELPRGVWVEILCDGTNIIASNPSQFPQTLAYAATLGGHDAANGERIIVGTLTNNITIPAPTNPRMGQQLIYSFTQDATGGRTITWNAVFKKAADGAGTANQIGATCFIFDGTNWVQIGGALAFFT